jgi:hypothetical protein
VTVKNGDNNDRNSLEQLELHEYDNMIVLSDDQLEPLTADSRVLVTLLHLRDMFAKRGPTPGKSGSIVSEMRDERDRALAALTKADDFVVSEQLVSLLMTQISENRHLESVFTDLFDPEGAELYVRPSFYYVRWAPGLDVRDRGGGGPPSGRGRHRLPRGRARRGARHRAQPGQVSADAGDRPAHRAGARVGPRLERGAVRPRLAGWKPPASRVCPTSFFAARPTSRRCATEFDAELLLSTLLGSVYGAAAGPDRWRVVQEFMGTFDAYLRNKRSRGRGRATVLGRLRGGPATGSLRVTGAYACGDRYGDQTSYVADIRLCGCRDTVVLSTRWCCSVDHNIGQVKEHHAGRARRRGAGGAPRAGGHRPGRAGRGSRRSSPPRSGQPQRLTFPSRTYHRSLRTSRCGPTV